MENPTDNYQPPDGARTWTFDEDVTAVFDDMLARSIPQYEVMRDACFQIADRHLPQKDGWVLDLGSSRGESVARLIATRGAQAKYALVEVAEPMMRVLETRFEGYIDAGCVKLFGDDLRHSIPPVPAHVAQSILTLQFVPINYRQQIIRRVYETLQPGGVFILVEKLLGVSSVIDEDFVAIYHALKHANGYPYDAIDRKRHALEGVLVPLTAQTNEAMLRAEGFRHVDCFWRWMNFAGFVGIKPE